MKHKKQTQRESFFIKNFNRRFGELYRTLKAQALMEKRRFTDRAFAKSLGISVGTLHHYKKGGRVPSVVVLFNLSEKFNVNPEWLLYGGTHEMFRGLVEDWEV